MKNLSSPVALILFLAFVPLSHAEKIDESALKGWGFLAHTLTERGMPEKTVRKIFLDRRMPKFSLVPFSITPKESKRLYSDFLSPTRVRKTKAYMKRHQRYFQGAEASERIPKEVIASIIQIETNLGTYTGNYRILPQLARLANAGSSKNVKKNYERLLKDKDQEEEVTFEKVEKRGEYLVNLFTPEVEATVRIASKKGFSPFAMRGSRAGAFGYAQFLPTSFERFAKDGNKDGIISLYQHPDAIYSVGSFLSHYVGDREVTESNLRSAIWEYNRSEPYVETVLKLSSVLGLKL